jgi:tetratricopeptide (TPR) repeat protein
LLAPLDTHDEAGAACDVFEYLPGGEIGRLRGRSWVLIARRLLPIADAVAALHECGWVHGDIKSANVLLDGDGLARLVDFGSARRSGATQPAGASPYSTSPERLDGASAAVADDIYAFGVLLYELVSGYPPFYPDIAPDRVRHEIPAPLAAQLDVPDGLRELVARCLAKRPDARPASMRDVRAALEHLAEESATSPTPPTTNAAAWQPRPPADGLPVQSHWRRTTHVAPSPQSLRNEGFRRGLLVGGLLLACAAAGFTFFVLPGLVASRQTVTAAPTTATTPQGGPATTAPAVTPPADLARLAAVKLRAEARRTPLAGRLQALEQRDVASWGGAEYAQVRKDLGEGDAAMTTRDFDAALARFDATANGLTVLERRLPAVVTERRAAAQAAFAAGRASEAAERYTAVLKVAPNDAAARTGLARTRVLDEVVRLMAAGATAEQAGDAKAATAAYRRVLELDPATAGAREGIARLGARATGDAYAAAMAQAMAALARQDYVAARAEFERAGRIRPGTTEVAEGLQQIQRVGETRSLAGTIERAVAAEKAEQWSQALALYGAALKTEPALRAAQEGVERAEPRAMMDAELQSLLGKPERLFSPAGRDIARNVLERAARMNAPGTHLQEQQVQLAALLRQAETPIAVALASDNATDVQIYRVGKLGLFAQKSLELMPGRYTVVGTRQGYRDVRKELNLLPGTAPTTLVVRCEEPI